MLKYGITRDIVALFSLSLYIYMCVGILGGVMVTKLTSQPSRMSLSLMGAPFIWPWAKSYQKCLVNYYMYIHVLKYQNNRFISFMLCIYIFCVGKYFKMIGILVSHTVYIYIYLYILKYLKTTGTFVSPYTCHKCWGWEECAAFYFFIFKNFNLI